MSLLGSGPSTAGAICAFVYNQSVFFIETNVRAVMLHFFFKDKEKVSDKEIMEVLKKVSSHHQETISPRDWYYALYDYGTFLKNLLEKIRLDFIKKVNITISSRSLKDLLDKNELMFLNSNYIIRISQIQKLF